MRERTCFEKLLVAALLRRSHVCRNSLDCVVYAHIEVHSGQHTVTYVEREKSEHHNMRVRNALFMHDSLCVCVCESIC